MHKLTNTHFDRYVEIYNSQGKEAAHEYVTQECNANYFSFQRILKNKSNYVYDRSTKSYRERSSEDQFMSLEELCATNPTTSVPIQRELCTKSDHNKIIYDSIIVDLMKDRLTEIAKYMLFEQGSREVRIDSKRLKQDGYTLIIT